MAATEMAAGSAAPAADGDAASTAAGPPDRRVALLVDRESLRRCVERETPSRPAQWDALLRFAQERGLVGVARVYGEWAATEERGEAYAAGLEPVFSPVLRTDSDREGKSLTDTVMMVQGMDLLWTEGVDVLVVCSVFKDLVPLVRAAKQRGVRVVLIGTTLTDVVLREMADEHVRYGALVGDGEDQAAAPAPPLRRRRRTTPSEAEAEAAAPASVGPAPEAAEEVADSVPPRPRRRRTRASAGEGGQV